MSKPHPTALDLAINMAAEKHETTEKALGSARARLQSAETTYTTLDSFRGEYAGRLRSVTRFADDKLGNYHRFLGKLTLALDSQKLDVDRAGQVVEQQQSAWFASLKRLKAMELLRDRRAAAAEKQLKRQEQKQSDEFAARSARRSRTHG